MTQADRILESTGARYARIYFAALHDLFVAKVRGNRPAARDARKALGEAMAATMGAAELLGAREFLAGLESRANFAAEQTVIPAVTFDEALTDFVTRAPATLRNAAERTAQRIAELYSEGRVVAFVKSAEETVTNEAQRFIDRALREGIGEGEAGQRLSMSVERVRELSEPWSEGYSRMVFRTNVNTAVTAGRFRLAQDPDVRAVAPAFRFDSVGDSDCRDNHDAADGVILTVDSTEWRRLAPPLGYNCRCQVSHVSAVELEALGRIRDDGTVVESRVPSSAGPDAGFRHGGRPDLFVNGQR